MVSSSVPVKVRSISTALSLPLSFELLLKWSTERQVSCSKCVESRFVVAQTARDNIRNFSHAEQEETTSSLQFSSNSRDVHKDEAATLESFSHHERAAKLFCPIKSKSLAIFTEEVV